MDNEFKFLSEYNRDEFVRMILKVKSEFLINNINPETFELLLKYLDIKNDLSFILTSDGNDIGMFLGATRAKTAYISNMFVFNGYRNGGYGTILLQKGTSIFQGQKCDTIKLEVLKENKAAISLYKKEGFQITGEIIQYQNNKKSFFRKPDGDMKIIKGDTFLFQPLFRIFKKKPVPWGREIRSLILLIEAGYADLDLLKSDNSVIGYAISTRSNGILKIYDLSLSDNSLIDMDIYLTLLTGNEKTVQVYSLYKDDSSAALLEKYGFYKSAIQYEMIKKI